MVLIPNLNLKVGNNGADMKCNVTKSMPISSWVLVFLLQFYIINLLISDN